MPDAENPAPKQSEDIEQPTTPTDISIEEYNQRADEYLDELVSRLEAEQETRPDVDVEYSVCLGVRLPGDSTLTDITGWCT